MHSVTIENDAVVMEVWPQIGGKVSSIIDKADNFELLFNFPAEIPDSPRYDVSYGNQWYCGWDECFPAIASGPYPRHPYAGIAIPDHGELWGIPATTAVPTKDGITTVWHGLRFGYRLTRKLYLDGPSINAEYTLVNLSPFEFQFVWAMHALMSLATPVEINYAQGSEFNLVLEDSGPPASRFDWPQAAPDLNFSRPDSLPARQRWKMFSQEPAQLPFTLIYPTRKRSVQIAYASEDGLPAYWGAWINTGGWGGNRHFAIEPTTGRHDHLERSIKDASAGKVDPFAKLTWSVRWTLS